MKKYVATLVVLMVASTEIGNTHESPLPPVTSNLTETEAKNKWVSLDVMFNYLKNIYPNSIHYITTNTPTTSTKACNCKVTRFIKYAGAINYVNAGYFYKPNVPQSECVSYVQPAGAIPAFQPEIKWDMVCE